MDLNSKNIAAIRQDYCLSSLDELETGDDPVLFFTRWFSEAEQSDCLEVNAMTLATVDEFGKPHARIVLLKGIEEGAFIFFSNYQSHKGMQMSANNNAALVFFWPELQRQVRIEGSVSKLSEAASDEYFYSRPISSQIGAVASPQSQKIESRKQLEDKVAKLAGSTDKVKRPVHWGGYALNPVSIEFWQGRSSRLHDRILFEKMEGEWLKCRLAP
jgi:pyridoxamine 5'-phosphate oxidase